jgi:prepilin-type N-terminal cleavage/methylation domain-containing protein/prepilin-type processing-associated H-X9-DG protein
MNKKQGFTLIELLVVISVIAILLAILMPALNKAGEYGKRIVCLGNLKGFQSAWMLYASSNDERLVNGEAWYQAAGGIDGTNGIRDGEPYWCGDDTGSATGSVKLSEEVQKAAIQSGALYTYVKSFKMYHCPTGIRGEVRNYAIVDSMNGYARTGTFIGSGASKAGVKVDRTTLWCKRTTDIKSPSATNRMVFGDEGIATTDSIATNYTSERWWDPGQVRHSNGNTYSFADGHADYWKWKGNGTIKNGRLPQPVASFQPVSDDDYKDLYRFQIAVWGKLGYPPTRSLQ